MALTTAGTTTRLRQTTGGLFLADAIAFAVAATVLSATFDWPDILRRPGDIVLPAFDAGGASLVWTWLATAWTYAILLAPVLLLPAVPGFPVWDLAGLLGSVAWGLWVAALGVTMLLIRGDADDAA